MECSLTFTTRVQLQYDAPKCQVRCLALSAVRKGPETANLACTSCVGLLFSIDETPRCYSSVLFSSAALFLMTRVWILPSADLGVHKLSHEPCGAAARAPSSFSAILTRQLSAANADAMILTCLGDASQNVQLSPCSALTDSAPKRGQVSHMWPVSRGLLDG